MRPSRLPERNNERICCSETAMVTAASLTDKAFVIDIVSLAKVNLVPKAIVKSDDSQAQRSRAQAC